jgi:hypothetical protein
MKPKYTHKTKSQARGAKHWKKVREQEWLDSFKEEKVSEPASYKKLAQETYEEWQNYGAAKSLIQNKRLSSLPLGKAIPPTWDVYLATSGLSKRTRYYIERCVNTYLSNPRVGWDFDEAEVISAAAFRFTLEQRARAILDKVRQKGVDPFLYTKALADFMSMDKLKEEEVVEFVLLATKLANKNRGLNSPCQPNFRLLWDLHVRAPKTEPWMKKVLLKVIGAKDPYYSQDGDRQVVSWVRLGNPADLFDACKAWKVSVLFPKKIAVRVGRLPLWKRMVAGQVIKQLLQERCDLTWHSGSRYSLSNDSWITTEFHQEFWIRFSEATQKGKMKNLEELIGKKINNKRILSCVIGEPDLVKGLMNYLGSSSSLSSSIRIRNFLGIKTGALREILEVTEMPEFSLTYFHLLPNYIGLIAIFGKNWKSYVDKVATFQKLYKPGEVKKDLEKLKQTLEGMHDYLYWVQPLGTPAELKGLDGFLLKWLKESPAELGVIVSTWHRLPEKVKKSNSFKEVLSEARTLGYEGFKSKPLALEAGKWGMDPTDYEKAEYIYLRSLKVPAPFSTNVRFELEGYVGRFLPREDVRVGFFGHYTNCCQHWTGVGKSCAISSVRDSFSQLFVVEKDGEILAGSWVWETHDQIEEDPDSRYSGVCFDNVEAKGLSSNQHYVVLELYTQAAEYLIHSGPYCKVTVGTNLGDLDVSSLPEEAYPLSLPAKYSGYNDSAKGQKVLATCWEDSRKYKQHESCGSDKVWVRGAQEEEDLYDLNEVATACYENSWAQFITLAGDSYNRRVLVLEHADHGIIGYTSLDTKSQCQEVLDMAVVPEYRRYSNLLLKESLEFMEAEGKVWEADAKEDTSYKLLKLYEKRGKFQLETLCESHYVDGVPCYRVRITFA